MPLGERRKLLSILWFQMRLHFGPTVILDALNIGGLILTGTQLGLISLTVYPGSRIIAQKGRIKEKTAWKLGFDTGVEDYVCRGLDIHGSIFLWLFSWVPLLQPLYYPP